MVIMINIINIIIMQTQQSSHGAEDAPVDVLYSRVGLALPIRLLLIDVT